MTKNREVGDTGLAATFLLCKNTWVSGNEKQWGQAWIDSNSLIGKDQNDKPTQNRWTDWSRSMVASCHWKHLNRRSGSEGYKFKTRCRQGLFTAQSPLKSTLPLEICIQEINSSVRCIGWPNICFTRAQLIKDPPVWWQPFKKSFLAQSGHFKRASPQTEQLS